MKNTFDKVLQRLSFEKLLIVSHLSPKRVRITLKDAVEASVAEPRILITLPAILLYKKTILAKADWQIYDYPKLKELVQNLFTLAPNKKFKKIEIFEFQQAAYRFKKFLDLKRSQQQSIARTFRLYQKDIEFLDRLSQNLNLKGHSQTLRHLIREKALTLGLSS